MATRIGDGSDSKKGNKSTDFEGISIVFTQSQVIFARSHFEEADFRVDAEKKKFFFRRVDLECIFRRILEIRLQLFRLFVFLIASNIGFNGLGVARENNPSLFAFPLYIV